MGKGRPQIGLTVALGMCLAWVMVSGYVDLFLLREMLRFGELVGITPTGNRLGGQILGFNYHRTSAWWGWVTLGVSGTVWLGIALLPAMWARRRLAAGTWAWETRLWREGWGIVMGGVVYTLIEGWCGVWLWERCVALGTALGGTAMTFKGMGIYSSGPFIGNRLGDFLGNMLVSQGARVVCGMAGCVLGVSWQAWTWRKDERAMRLGVCGECGYDLRGLREGVVCPECGRKAAG